MASVHLSCGQGHTEYGCYECPECCYNYYALFSMKPNYRTANHPTPETTLPQSQPLIMPQTLQWPSMLTSQSPYHAPFFPSAPPPITSESATPVSATPTHSRTSSKRRKTLTGADRRRICQYHEDNPTVKQTEIGAMFGVERSTVSKVLRQKEEYLDQDDGSRSPMKGSKGKPSDIERALSEWARNLQRRGLPVSDAMIQNKVRFFAQTVGNSESHLKANSNSWLEEFVQENRLMGAGSEGTLNSPSNKHTTGATSPTLPGSVPSATAPLEAKKIEKTTEIENPNTGESLSHLPSSGSQISAFLPGALTGVASGSTPSREEAADAMRTVVVYLQSRRAAFQEELEDLSIMEELQKKLEL